MKLLSRFKNSKKYQLMFSSIGLVIAICFSFVAFGGFAWFSNNKEVNATGMQVIAKDPEFIDIQEYHIYKLSDDTVGLVEEVSNSSSLAEVAMNEYDAILTEKNFATRMIIKVILRQVRTNRTGIQITASNDTTLESETAPMSQYTSNIISVRSKYGRKNDNMSDVFESFDEDTTTPYNSFLDVERQDEDNFENVKEDSFDINLDSFSSNVYTEDEINKLVLYIELTYNGNNVNEYILQNTTDEHDFMEDLDVNIDFPYDLNPFELNYR